MLIIQHRAQDAEKISDRADLVEVDVMMTADAQIVCRHDHIYEGRPVWEQNYDDGMGRTLQRFIALAGSDRLIIELKLPELHWAAGLEHFEKVVTFIKPFPVAFSSFSVASLVKIRRDSPVGLIANTHDNRLPAPVADLATLVSAVAVPKSDLLSHSEHHNLPLFVYTANSPADLPESRATGVFTDHPENWK